MRGKKMRGEKSRANTPAGHQFPSGNWFSQLGFFFGGGGEGELDPQIQQIWSHQMSTALPRLLTN